MGAKDPAVYLLHIRDSCMDLMECAGFRGEVSEKVLYQAACRCLEVIGEAANKLGSDFHREHPDVPWRQMVATRNILIHNYDGTEPDHVWAIVDRDIPPLLLHIRRILAAKGETR